ncbi:MAG: hypothetical protein ACKV2V_07495, partial [Blastocatellia bacterium]
AQPVRVESGGGALAEWRDRLSSWLSAALSPRWIPAATLAALILLAMGTTLYNSLVYREATPDSAAHLPMPTPSVETPRPIINNTIDKPAPRDSATPGVILVKENSPRRAARRTMLAQAAYRNRQDTTAGEYIPLTWMPDKRLLQSGVVLRMELEPSSLQALGLTIEPSRGGGKVRADVVMGDTGVPLAIRLLPAANND